MKAELKHTLGTEDKWKMVLAHLFQRKYGWFGYEDDKRITKCGACGTLGHMCTNKLCEMYVPKKKKKNEEDDEEEDEGED